MELENKLFKAKILGEIYRVQKEQGIYNGTEGRIYGLINGFEEDINSEIESLNFISDNEVNLVCDQFDPYYKEERSLEEIPPYKDIEMALERKGLHRDKFYSIIKYLYLNDRYTVEIDRINSGIKNSVK
ncbi:hypothetical protein [Guptibacillus hwajinpoensis]|uniref:hypothetical protein n=1 Tax=Guptibacillus hwajinpoensis TaxID=208199 RepID=UPI0037359E3E